MLDVLRPLGHKKILENELEGFGIRLNKTPPNIHFKRKEKGKQQIDMLQLINYFNSFLHLIDIFFNPKIWN